MTHPLDRQRVGYEWFCDEFDSLAPGEIVDTNGFDTYAEAFAHSKRCELPTEIALAFFYYTEAGGMTDRYYAYLEDGKLPTAFENGRPIPQRFHKEVLDFK